MKTSFAERSSVALAIVLFSFSVQGQSEFLYDQQSANENTGSGGGFAVQLNQPIGQSFTPTLSSVGFVRLLLNDSSINGAGATMYVNLRADSIAGPILGSTEPVFMPDGFGLGNGNRGFTNFLFSTPVAVVPGETYFFQPVVQSGASTWQVTGYNYGYPGGTMYIQGQPNTVNDLWFREGIVVPEPSSVWLVLLGAGALVYAQFFRQSIEHACR